MGRRIDKGSGLIRPNVTTKDFYKAASYIKMMAAGLREGSIKLTTEGMMAGLNTNELVELNEALEKVETNATKAKRRYR